MRDSFLMFHAAAALPYAVDEVPGAEHLVVAFPKLHPGGAAPPVSLRRRFRRLRAHRLFVGSDRHTYLGPARSMAGARTAIELIRHEAQRLDVPMQNVITAGTSMGELCALQFGLSAEAGQVFAGAPPVRIGSQLQRLSKIEGPVSAAKEGAAELFALGDAGEAETPTAEFLDRPVFETVEHATHRATVHLLVSPTDKVYKPTRALAKAMAKHPTIDCVLVERMYRSHTGIKEVFLPYREDSLAELVTA